MAECFLQCLAAVQDEHREGDGAQRGHRLGAEEACDGCLQCSPSANKNLESTPCSSLLVSDAAAGFAESASLCICVRNFVKIGTKINPRMIASSRPSPRRPPRHTNPKGARPTPDLSISEDPTLKSNLVKRRPREA